MEFTATKAALWNVLPILNRVLHTTPSQPILCCVKITVTAAQVLFTVFDEVVGIEVIIEDAHPTEQGSVAVPIKLFTELISKLKGSITVTEQQGGLVISSEQGEFGVLDMDVSNYPVLPDLSNLTPLIIPAQVIEEGIKSVLFATSHEQANPILSGVCLEISPDTFKFSATDGHQIAYSSFERIQTGDPLLEDVVEAEEDSFSQTIIPARALAQLQKMVEGKSDDVAFFVTENQIEFGTSTGKLTVRPLSGTYPNYKTILDRLEPSDKTIILDRQGFLEAITIASVIANKGKQIIRFDVDYEGQQLEIKTEVSQAGASTQTIPAKIKSPGESFGLNSRYLLELLKSLPASTIEIKYFSPSQPFEFIPLSGIKMSALLFPINPSML